MQSVALSRGSGNSLCRGLSSLYTCSSCLIDQGPQMITLGNGTMGKERGRNHILAASARIKESTLRSSASSGLRLHCLHPDLQGQEHHVNFQREMSSPRREYREEGEPWVRCTEGEPRTHQEQGRYREYCTCWGYGSLCFNRNHLLRYQVRSRLSCPGSSPIACAQRGKHAQGRERNVRSTIRVFNTQHRARRLWE